jgi:hypothetical protein
MYQQLLLIKKHNMVEGAFLSQKGHIQEALIVQVLFHGVRV